MLLTLGVSMWVTGLLIALFLLISVLLILTILIQRPQGGGLSGAFGAGGGGSGQTAFGAKTGDALTITTVVTFVVWLAVAISLVFVTRASVTAAPPAPTEAAGELEVPSPSAPPPAGAPAGDPETDPEPEPEGNGDAGDPGADPDDANDPGADADHGGNGR